MQAVTAVNGRRKSQQASRHGVHYSLTYARVGVPPSPERMRELKGRHQNTIINDRELGLEIYIANHLVPAFLF